MAHAHPPPPAAPNPSQPLEGENSGGKRVWRVGTLAYTGGGLIVLCFWLLWGDFAWQMKERSVSGIVPVVLKKFGAADTLIGLLTFTLPLMISAVVIPIFSYKSDRYRSKHGRRIPFLIVTAPLGTLLMVAMAFSPAFGKMIHTFLGDKAPSLNNCTLISFGIAWGFFEIVTLLSNHLVGALVNDVVPREFIGRFFGLFRAVSLFCGIIFSYFLFSHAQEWYFYMFIGFGLLYGIGFTLMCVMVKEGDYPQPDPLPPSLNRSILPPGIVAFFVECLTQRYYLTVFAALALANASISCVNLFSSFFVQSLFPETDLGKREALGVNGSILAFSYICSFFLAFIIGHLADKLHPARLCLIVMGTYAVGMLLGGVLIGDVLTYKVAFFAHVILSGCFYTASASIGQRLFPRAKFAQYAAAAALFHALTMWWVGPALGLLLDFTKFNLKYRLTYLAAGLMMIAAMGVWLVVLRHFKNLGGYKDYVAPEGLSTHPIPLVALAPPKPPQT